MTALEELSGTIERCIYQSNENGFGVFLLKHSAQETITICGYLAHVHPGHHTVVRGTWVIHPKFGKQFNVQECIVTLPTSTEGLKRYLSSGLIKGIGKVYAEKLVAHFGAQVLEVIEKEPQKLAQVPGIGAQRTTQIINAWQEQRSIANIMVFLQDKGISIAYAIKIFKHYKEQALTLITENPYRLADDVWGIGFKTADAIAQKLGFNTQAPARINAGILHVLKTATASGHLYMQEPTVIKTVMELLGIEEPAVQESITMLLGTQRLVRLEKAGQTWLTLSQYLACEKAVALSIERLNNNPVHHGLPLDAIYTMIRTAPDITLTETQQRALLACLQHRITVITGGPGTGKTTIIKKLLDIFDTHGLRYKLTAPTGRAAKRITESTGRYALTIHRLLEFDPATLRFVHNEQNALSLDYLIIDESSMIDIFLMHAIMRALPFNAHLVLIGDVDQLPSVGPGNVLRDIIASGTIPTLQLNTIFRQAENSLIIRNAHAINMGQYPSSAGSDGIKDFIMIHEADPQRIAQHLSTIYTTILHQRGFSAQQSMVLTPMNRGTAGTQHINYHLKQLLNPCTSAFLSYMGTQYHVGDRVMQLRNNYDKKVFNGDLGTIEQIDAQQQTMQVRYLESLITYEHHELDEIALAYAITIHKSQGSEFPVVIITLFMQHFTLLQRNLLYTAVTRAKKLCILIGPPKAIAMTVKNNKEVQRCTFLKDFLMHTF